MNNFYDNLLIKNVEEQNITYTVISNLSYYMENLSKHFPFIGSRIDFSSLHNYKLVKSDQENVSFDVVNFIQKLIEEKIFSKEDEIIYIGDSLTEVGYEFYLVYPYKPKNPLIHSILCYKLFANICKFLYLYTIILADIYA